MAFLALLAFLLANQTMAAPMPPDGIAHWMNTHYHLKEERQLDKNCELVHEVKKWVDAEYESGRVTVLTDEELLKVIDDASKKLGILLV